jgi:hypothetical protein
MRQKKRDYLMKLPGRMAKISERLVFHKSHTYFQMGRASFDTIDF